MVLTEKIPFVLLAALFSTAAPAPRPAGELPLGAIAPVFTLRGTDGQDHALVDLAGVRGTAIVFTCNTCPYSLSYEPRLIHLAREFQARGVAFVAINPNEATGDAGESLEKMVKRAASRHYPFPYLVDADQEIARAYGARVTPHVFLLDAGGRLVYRGRIDDAARPEQVTTEDLKKALHALLDGKPTPSPATRAFGCTIRWNPEIAP